MKQRTLFLLGVLGVIVLPAPLFAQQVQENCYQSGPIQICQPFIEIDRPLPGQDSAPAQQTPPSEAAPETPTLSDFNREQLGGEPSVLTPQPTLSFDMGSPSNFPARRTGQVAAVAAGAVLAVLGAITFASKERVFKNKKIKYTVGAALVLGGGGLAAAPSGCNPFEPIPFCQYVLVSEESLLPVGAPEGQRPFIRPEPLASGAGMTEVEPPLPTIYTQGQVADIRLPGESAGDCIDRCRAMDLYLFEVCPDKEPRALSKETLSSEEKSNFCAAACRHESVLEFLDETTVGA